MPEDQPPEVVTPAQIVWPEKDQVEQGLAELKRYAPLWKACPALLVVKPHLALIVSLEKVEYDDRYFTLVFVLEEVILAPESFDAQRPVRVNAVWNQPYMSVSPGAISAPYSFYLHFGARGVQHIRELMAMKTFDKMVRDPPVLLGFLRCCFIPGFEMPKFKDDTD